MKSSRHEFDPNGDVELVLKSPNTQELIPLMAFWQLLRIERKCMSSGLESWLPPNQPKKTQPVAVAQRGAAASVLGPTPPVPGAATPSPTKKTATATALPEKLIEGTNVPPVEIRMQLSSRHLILASPFFRKMLGGPWQEGTSGSVKLREITASGWDEEALVIVLDAIHGHHRDVPKSLDLETLAKIAVIVDYYGCTEAMEPYVRPWILDEHKTLTQFCGPDCLLWLCVSWVFSQPRIFEAMSELIVKHTEGPIDVPNLPIGEILEEIEAKRIDLIDQILADLEIHCDKLHCEKAGCRWECSTMLLGSIMKGRHTLAKLQPPVTRPYHGTGHSLERVLSIVAGFREPMWSTFDEQLLRKTPHNCSVRTLLQPSIQKFQEGMRGLNLEDFGRTGVSDGGP
ncbi:hypothetical protein EDB81DRAFT_707713 [Dactylonectria macrodidyma]|uniref:BTB domain-containing protein n=1 Tax=Dactylonectria macrodidyma TaxID=307937 RepID=A0A9P9FUK9_9HYPO|nr:hypothetical protein EDB81DRAFT_707713 [Dactylonectria macrodidyma]